MKNIFSPAMRILESLPAIFELMPKTDYGKLYSHSAADITKKAWAMTGQQMHDAFTTFEKTHPTRRGKTSKAR